MMEGQSQKTKYKPALSWVYGMGKVITRVGGAGTGGEGRHGGGGIKCPGLSSATILGCDLSSQMLYLKFLICQRNGTKVS